ncbi:MAG TPA: N-acetyltransferase [Sulfobacillus sp.]|jgi:RimJ/RimL family protein N-acetyltransferase|nr:N-acetyltransferase [Sulfobacillus sp.]
MVLDIDGHYRYIRKLADRDLTSIALWDEDEEVTILSGKKFGQGSVIDSVWWQDLMTSSVRIGFAIQTPGGVLIGDAELEHIAWRNAEAELRISIGNKYYWSRGYGSAAIREVLHVAYERIGLQRVYLRVKRDNFRAIRAYEKAGFKKVAVLCATGRLAGATELVLMESLGHQYWTLRA